jgi:hypothetical protein
VGIRAGDLKKKKKERKKERERNIPLCHISSALF